MDAPGRRAGCPWYKWTACCWSVYSASESAFSRNSGSGTGRPVAGLAHARQNGKRLGRPATAAVHAAEIRKLHRADVSKSEIARRLQIGRTSVRRILAHAISRGNSRPAYRYAGSPKAHALLSRQVGDCISTTSFVSGFPRCQCRWWSGWSLANRMIGGASALAARGAGSHGNLGAIGR